VRVGQKFIFLNILFSLGIRLKYNWTWHLFSFLVIPTSVGLFLALNGHINFFFLQPETSKYYSYFKFGYRVFNIDFVRQSQTTLRYRSKHMTSLRILDWSWWKVRPFHLMNNYCAYADFSNILVRIRYPRYNPSSTPSPTSFWAWESSLVTIETAVAYIYWRNFFSQKVYCYFLVINL